VIILLLLGKLASEVFNLVEQEVLGSLMVDVNLLDLILNHMIWLTKMLHFKRKRMSWHKLSNALLTHLFIIAQICDLVLHGLDDAEALILLVAMNKVITRGEHPICVFFLLAVRLLLLWSSIGHLLMLVLLLPLVLLIVLAFNHEGRMGSSFFLEYILLAKSFLVFYTSLTVLLFFLLVVAATFLIVV